MQFVLSNTLWFFPLKSVLYDWPSVITLLKLSKENRCIRRSWARTSYDYLYQQHGNLGSRFIIAQSTAREKNPSTLCKEF